MNSISQELTRASFTGHPLGAVTTDTFPFDFPSLYPKSNHNVNTKSKSKSPLSHTDQEQSATAVQVETCPHTPGESSTQLLRESHKTQSDAGRPRGGRVSWGQAQGGWWGAGSYVNKPTPRLCLRRTAFRSQEGLSTGRHQDSGAGGTDCSSSLFQALWDQHHRGVRPCHLEQPSGSTRKHEG